MEENIFVCMELSKQSYLEVSLMPVQKFYKYIKWKNDLEEKKKQMLEENIDG